MARRRGGLNFRKQRRKFNLPLFKEILSWIIECAIVICMAYVLVSTFGVRTNIVGPAMESTLQDDDDVFINKFIYMISRPKAVEITVRTAVMQISEMLKRNILSEKHGLDFPV